MTSMRAPIAVLVAVAALLFSAFFLLGIEITRRGEPAVLLRFAYAVRGNELRVAWAFTNAGWPAVLGPLYAACAVMAIFVRRARVRALYLLGAALAAWGCADAMQRLFARPRRTDWLIRHEHAYSYPSSHAAIATAFYLLAGVLIVRSEMPARLRYPIAAACIVMWAGILWSRLALAAHYPTDIAGGILLGLLISVAGAAIVRLTGASLSGRPRKVVVSPGRGS